jgi:HK97 family phage prohead protease
MNNYIGYGALFTPDHNHDIFIKNSFFIRKTPIPLLYEHKYIIGHVETLIEDVYGLKINFYITNLTIEKLVQKKLLKNLSIGYEIKDYEKDNLYRYLKKVEVLEISIVRNAAQSLATFWPNTSQERKKKYGYNTN